MRRADRLFRIVEFLKARRQPVTARALATTLEVNVRTIYRDIADLTASGVPIIGEAGVGYVLDRGYTVRPMMFDVEELDALVLGARMVESWGDREIAKSATKAIDKIKSVLPASLKDEFLDAALFSPPSRARAPIAVDFSALRRAIRAKRFVTFDYDSLAGERTSRKVRPLCLVFFGPVWLFMGWCESRRDFRNFRLDRMRNLVVTADAFVDERGKRLIDFERQCGQNC